MNGKLITTLLIAFLIFLVTACGKQIDSTKIMTAGSGATFYISSDNRGQEYFYDVDIINYNDEPIVIENIEPVFSEKIASLKTSNEFDYSPTTTLAKEQSIKVSGKLYIKSTEKFSDEETRNILKWINIRVKGFESPIFLTIR